MTDPQSRAYRTMTAADAIPDDELLVSAVRSYAPLAGPPDMYLVGREDYDADEWDRGREDPR